MQQRLAVASVFVLVLLAGMSAVLIIHNAVGQSAPKPSTQQLTSHDSTSTRSTSTNSNSSSGGSLLTTATNSSTGSDDGNETEHESGIQTTTNSTLDE